MPHAQVPELLPCPFCGGEAGTLMHVDSKTYRIWCLRPTQKCGAILTGISKEAVETTWNRRAARPAAAQEADAWMPIETAPKDGTMLMLLIGSDDGRQNPLEDTAEGSRTIGFNNFDNDGEDVWLFAGWCWSHDHFTEGKGTPIHWQPLPLSLHAPAAPGERQVEPVGIVQRLSVAGTPMPDSTGVEWLKPVPAGAKLYLHAPAAPAEQKIIRCKTCHVVIYDDAAKTGYCADHEPPAAAGETAELVGRLRAEAQTWAGDFVPPPIAVLLTEAASALARLSAASGEGK